MKAASLDYVAAKRVPGHPLPRTPGMLMMAGYPGPHSTPDDKTVGQRLSGQIRRCTGYVNIVRAAGKEIGGPPAAVLWSGKPLPEASGSLPASRI